MRSYLKTALCAVLLFAAALPGQASTIFTAFLTGSHENPPTDSAGTGIGTIVLNDAQNMITVDESWTGLTTPATASHIHIATTFGGNGPVVFPFSGVPSATAGAIPEQTFAVTSAQVAALFQGLWYFNVHTSIFSAGEIRGNVVTAVPEPGTIGLLGLGVFAVAIRRRRHN